MDQFSALGRPAKSQVFRPLLLPVAPIKSGPPVATLSLYRTGHSEIGFAGTRRPYSKTDVMTTHRANIQLLIVTAGFDGPLKRTNHLHICRFVALFCPLLTVLAI